MQKYKCWNGGTRCGLSDAYRVLPLAPFEMDKIPDDYAFVLISKKGVPFSDTIDDIYSYNPSQTFYDNESLDYRVWQGDKVMSPPRCNDIIKL